MTDTIWSRRSEAMRWGRTRADHKYTRGMRRRLVFLAVAAASLGCNREMTPVERAAGSWPGQFTIESVKESEDKNEIAKWAMKGNLWLFVTKESFRLEMNTANQAFTVKGRWEAKGNRITMRGDTYEFTFPKEEDIQAMNLPIVTADQIRSTFHAPIVLDLAEDRRTLTGLKTSMGSLIGKFEFTRPIPR